MSGSLDNESIAHDSTKLTLSQVDAELTRLRERLAAETGRADSGERTIQELFKLLAAVEGERDEARFERDSYIAAHNELEEQLREARARCVELEAQRNDLDQRLVVAVRRYAAAEPKLEALEWKYREQCAATLTLAADQTKYVAERDAARKDDLETAVGLLRDRRPTPAWNKHVEHFLAAHPVKPSGT